MSYQIPSAGIFPRLLPESLQAHSATIITYCDCMYRVCGVHQIKQRIVVSWFFVVRDTLDRAVIRDSMQQRYGIRWNAQ